MLAPGTHVLEALRALRRHPLRSVLTMLGIVVGVAAVVVVFGVSEGARQQVLARIHSLGGNLLLIQPGIARRGGAELGVGSRPSLDTGDAEAIRREIPGVLLSAPSVFGRLQVIRGHRNRLTTVQGITPAYLEAREWPVALGRPISALDVATRAKVALLGSTVAEALFAQQNPVGQTVRLGSVPVAVIGVLEAKGQSSGGADQDEKVMIPLTTATARVLGSGELGRRQLDYIMVKVRDEGGLAAVSDAVRALLRQRHGLPPGVADDFTLRDLAELQRRKAEASGVLTFWLTTVASVALLVGTISVANIMLVAVAERTREIGLRLAVGARPRDVRNQFLVEATLLGAGGGLIGTVLGLLSAWAIGASAGMPIRITPAAVLLALAASAMVGVVAGLVPALKAAGLTPLAALRAE
jgi:ABC-type antimicrobial peptide transport system permease subunit